MFELGMDALDRAVSILGSQSGLAEACGVVQGAVANWKARKNVPAQYCAAIEIATKGAVTRIDLRPHDWWLIWPELAEKHPELVPKHKAVA
ncbi:MAG: helix-turn-helix domain-containing protein [Steroidobacteraceae bacterium]|nr:helix-turn-helix domain-containing protein [Steroidobacteraceae bacterium]